MMGTIVDTGPTGMPLRVISNRTRAERLMRSAVADMAVDLRGMTVLTEAASGPFAVTPLLALLAGAEQVYAVTRDSRFGSAADVQAYVGGWAEALGLSGRLRIAAEPARAYADRANVVTNLGFVRPIDRELIRRLPDDSAIPLMWEPWEFRPEDLDLLACRERNVPVAGTRESHSRVNTLAYVGLLALKLLLEAGIEVLGSRLLVVGSDPFGAVIAATLHRAGAEDVSRFQPASDGTPDGDKAAPGLADVDAVVMAEHTMRRLLIGAEAPITPAELAARDIALVHICGAVDVPGLERAGVPVHPAQVAPPGYMSETTAYLGPKPIIDLHCAGLKVGEAMVRAMREHGSADAAVAAAVESGYGLALEPEAI